MSDEIRNWGGAILPFLILASCATQVEDRPSERSRFEFHREDIAFGRRAFLDSQWVLIQVNHDSVFGLRDTAAAGNAESDSTKRTVRNYLVRADSMAPVKRLKASWFDPLSGISPLEDATFERSGPWKLLETQFGLEYDLRLDSIYFPKVGEHGTADLCGEAVGLGWIYARSDFRAGPSPGTYLLSCSDEVFAFTDPVHAYFRIGADGKATRLRADSAGEPWIGVVAIEGEIWGAFLAPDSLSVRFAPLDSGGADRAYTIGLREKIRRHRNLNFFHTWNRLWLGYDGDVVPLSGPADSSDWIWAWNDNPFDVLPIRLDDGAKQVQITSIDPPYPTLTYDFSEFLK